MSERKGMLFLENTPDNSLMICYSVEQVLSSGFRSGAHLEKERA